MYIKLLKIRGKLMEEDLSSRHKIGLHVCNNELLDIRLLVLH
jgi:hypothetical protein